MKSPIFAQLNIYCDFTLNQTQLTFLNSTSLKKSYCNMNITLVKGVSVHVLHGGFLLLLPPQNMLVGGLAMLNGSRCESVASGDF